MIVVDTIIGWVHSDLKCNMLEMLKIWLKFNKIYCFTVTIIASELCSNLIRFAIILILPRAGRPPAASSRPHNRIMDTTKIHSLPQSPLYPQLSNPCFYKQ